MRFTHQSTAYILRWNKPDYKEIIGVFLTEALMEKFITSYFYPDERDSLTIERGRHYVQSI